MRSKIKYIFRHIFDKQRYKLLCALLDAIINLVLVRLT